MQSRRYVICDIEATGLHSEKEIIEIALLTYQDGKVIEVWESLVNPLTGISDFIQDFTLISHKSLKAAPKFYDLADAIRLRLEGSILVSHKVEFDYQLLQKNFQRMGQELKLKTYCTLKASQRHIPGLKAYSLEALSNFFGHAYKTQHRAMPDAEATLKIFRELNTLEARQSTRPLYLPQHEKQLSRLPQRAGLVIFKNIKGEKIFEQAASNMAQAARKLLVVSPPNHRWLREVEFISGEITGSALIAEIRRLESFPFKPRWMIKMGQNPEGELGFKLIPFHKNQAGLWYFRHLQEAKIHLKRLQKMLQGERFLYREGGKSKEEIIRHNQRAQGCVKETRFPTENLIVLGEGRVAGERSLVLVRDGHVIGFGYGQGTDAEILANPEQFISQRFHSHLGADLATLRFLRELKHMRNKTDSWRSLAQDR